MDMDDDDDDYRGGIGLSMLNDLDFLTWDLIVKNTPKLL
jgi:hypothetical protein